VRTVKFRRTGGYAGNLPALEFNTAGLPPAQRARIAGLIADVDFDAIEPRSAQAVPDAFRYDLEVTTGDHHRRLTVGDRHVPETLRPLLDQLTELARQRRRRN
jgi:hypothetical protein